MFHLLFTVLFYMHVLCAYSADVQSNGQIIVLKQGVNLQRHLDGIKSMAIHYAKTNGLLTTQAFTQVKTFNIRKDNGAYVIDLPQPILRYINSLIGTEVEYMEPNYIASIAVTDGESWVRIITIFETVSCLIGA